MTGSHRAFASRNFFLRPKDIFALCDASICITATENRAAAADLSIIDDDKGSEIRNPVVIIYYEWRSGLDCNSANLVSLQLFSSIACCLECRGICYVLDRDDLTFHVLRCQTQVTKTSDPQRIAHDPEQVRMKTIRLDRCFVLVRCDVTALDKNLFRQSDTDRIVSYGRSVYWRVPTLDRSDYCGLI